MHKLNKRASTLVTSLVLAFAFAGIAIAGPAKPKCLKGSSSSPSYCGVMCNTIANGDPNGSIDADCQNCCGQMGKPNSACYTACSASNYPCDCS